MAADAPRRAGWQPNESDRLLLQVLLLPGPAARAAWRDWSARVALDDVGPAAYRLLPELYHVLLAAGVETPDLPRLKGISRKTWYENQLQRAVLEALIRTLANAGVNTLLLRGALHAAQGSAPHSLRNTSDLACAVPFAQALSAFQALAQAGWLPAAAGAIPQRHWRFRASLAFCQPAGQGTLELVWRSAPADGTGRAESGLWQRRQPACLAGQATAAPDVTDQLWLACLAGVSWQPEPDWRWLVDAVRLIQTEAIDWPRLVDTGRQTQSSCCLSEALSFMASVLTAPVPAAVLEQLKAATPAPAEARLFRLTSQRQGRLGLARKHWLQYCLWTDGQPNPAGFVRYLEAQWALASSGQALLEAGRRGLRARSPAA